MSTSTSVRVTVTSDTRRVDLVLPGAVPLVELLPELARSVGLLDSRVLHDGFRLLTSAGRVLTLEDGLTSQGVEDGAFVAVVAGSCDGPARVYDDVVEAMADVVAGHDLESRPAIGGRQVALGASVLMLMAGAGGLLTGPGSPVSAAAAVGLTLALLLAAVAHSRIKRETATPVTVALAGCVFAATAGLALVTGQSAGSLMAAGGGGLLVAGVLAGVGLAEGRVLLLPAVVLGAVLLSTGLVVRASMVDPAVVLTPVLAGVVVVGSEFPRLAVAVTGTGVPPLFTSADITRDPDPIDLARVSGDARVADQIMVAMSATVGVLLVVLAPRAVSLGRSGTIGAVLACLVVALRSRGCRSDAEVRIGLGSAMAGLISTALSVACLHPGWRLAEAFTLTVSGLVLLGATLVPAARSMRLRRLGDGVESLALLAIVPTLVVATGLLSAVQDRVG